MTLTVSRSPGQVVCRMFFNWDWSDFFSHDKTGVVYFWEKNHRGKVLLPSLHIRGRCYQHNITTENDCEHQAEVWFVGFLYCKVTLGLLSFHTVLAGK